MTMTISELETKLVDRHQITVLKRMNGPVDIVGINGYKLSVTAQSVDTTGRSNDQILELFACYKGKSAVSIYEINDTNVRFSTIRLDV